MSAKHDTPCVNLCALDPASGTCRGCGRTMDEIGAWTSMTNAERRAVLDRLDARRRQQHQQQQ